MLSRKSYSQVMGQKIEFYNPSIKLQADSLKKLYANQGFVIARETGMSMETEYETPILLPLKEGTWYRVVFIGDITSKLYEVRMYDWKEKQVFYAKKMWGDVDGNIISYDYVSKFTEYHMLKLVQVNKNKKQVGGYFMIFKKKIP